MENDEVTALTQMAASGDLQQLFRDLPDTEGAPVMVTGMTTLPTTLPTLGRTRIESGSRTLVRYMQRQAWPNVGTDRPGDQHL